MASNRNEAGTTIKRRKEKENSSKEGSQKSDKKKILKYDWNQNDSEVIVIFNLGSRVDNNSITHKFTDHTCFIQFEDGRSWQCDLYQAVVEEGTNMQIKGNKVILKMVKKIPNVHWSQLEYKKNVDDNQRMDVDFPKMKKPVVEILDLKTDCHEQDEYTFTVFLCVKNIRKDTFKIHFKENYFIVLFQTSDQSILKQYPSSTSDTFFSWKENTKETIKPDECKYTLTSTRLEINLKKNVPKFWERNETSSLPSEQMESNLNSPIRCSRSPLRSNRNMEGSPHKIGDVGSDRSSSPKHMVVDNRMENSNYEKERGMDESKDVDVECPEKENSIVEIPSVKHNFFERTPEVFTVQVYVKNIKKESLKVQFKENYFVILFQTVDPKFCAQYPTATPDSFFSWRVNLKESINPEECSYKVSTACLEITLKKNTPKMWGGLEAMLTAAPAVPSNTWVPVTQTGASASTAYSSTTGLSAVYNAKEKDNEVNAVVRSSQLATQNCKGDILSDIKGSKIREALMEQLPTNQIMTDNRKEHSKKPTCMVSPLNKGKQHEQIVTPGLTGLDNLGNTCFMNSVLQCLANTREFRDYFFEGYYQQEINKDNPLGMGGNMAVAFAVLLRVLWSGTHRSYAPSKLKMLTSMKAPQFSGFAQHDAQEFMAFFLDGLHEDLNRIIDKPYTQSIDSDGRPDKIVAEDSWRLYKQRNDSIVVDLFQGQYKSKLVCPVCNKVSITFDPFLYLSVPLPKKQHFLPVFFFSKDPYRRPVKYLIKIPVEATVEELKEKIFILTKVHPHNLRVFEVYNGKIHKFFKKESSLSDVSPNDIIFVFEVVDPQLAGGKVLELAVIQRVIMPKPVTKCSFCKRDCTPGEKKLRRCTKCFRVGYCDQNCQKNHWQAHKNQCRLIPEPVGCPFVISIPESQATFSKLCRLMEAFSRYSVDVFQPPVQLGDVHCHSNSVYSSSSSVSSTADVQSVDSALGTSEELCDTENGDQKSEKSNLVLSATLTSANSCASEENSALQFQSGEPVPPEQTIWENEKYCDPLLEKSTRQSDAKTNMMEAGPSSSELPYPSMSTLDEEVDMMTPLPNVHNKPTVNLVLGQPQNDVMERSPPPFHIRKVTENGQPVSGSDKEYLEDKGDKPLDLYNCYYLAMEWKNNEKLKNYVLVQSKDLTMFTLQRFGVMCGIARTHDLLKWSSHFEQCNSVWGLFVHPSALRSMWDKFLCSVTIGLLHLGWYCPRCKEHREATKQLSLWRVPTVLIIQLKRFSFKNFIWRDKIDKMVNFPVRGLDLSQFFCGPLDPSGVPPVYDLFAVINHHGSILGGHYTAFARCVDLQNTRRSEVDWRLFDDSRVSFVPESSVVTKAAYMLFYRRRGVPFTLPRSIASNRTNGPVERSQHRNDIDTELVPGNEETVYSIMDSNILAYEGDDGDLATPPSITDMDSVD